MPGECGPRLSVNPIVLIVALEPLGEELGVRFSFNSQANSSFGPVQEESIAVLHLCANGPVVVHSDASDAYATLKAVRV